MLEKENSIIVKPHREENSLVQIDRLTRYILLMQGTQILKKLAGQHLMFSVHTKVGVILIFRFFFSFVHNLFPIMYIVEKGK